jgi:hypothetical protein
VARQTRTSRLQGERHAGGHSAGSTAGQGRHDGGREELKDIPRGRLTGIQNGPDCCRRPTSGSDAGAVCDRYKLDPSLNNPAESIKPDTKAAEK